MPELAQPPFDEPSARRSVLPIAQIHESQSLEIPVDDALRRARPFPPYPEMVIDDLTDEEAEAFFKAVNS